MNYTSIEQSKKLLELGLNSESADMCYPLYGIAKPEGKYPLLQEKNTEGIPNINIPCWSVGALLEVMPKIIHDEEYGHSYYLSLNRGCDIDRWACEYVFDECLSESTFIADTQIDAVYQMVVWLLENNYIKQ